MKLIELSAKFAASRLGNSMLTRYARAIGKETKSFAAQSHRFALPAGYPASTLEIELSVPDLPKGPIVEFSEHATDEAGDATDIVLATFANGFALSRDLGRQWNRVIIPGLQGRRIIRAKWIGDGELLLAASTKHSHASERSVTLFVAKESGEILAETEISGSPWHGCRGIDMAGGVLMFAEYPDETLGKAVKNRFPSRVFRSLDRGRSWQIVKAVHRVRHFHFLQSRPGASEWWLTSGDSPRESRIWISRNAGESWLDRTRGFRQRVNIGGVSYPRSIFRLTDMAWVGKEVVWGTDDFLRRTIKEEPGARIFRSRVRKFNPRLVGRCQWEIRNLVDIGEFLLVLAQGNHRPHATPDEQRPGVFLLPKSPIPSAPGVIHLFDLENHSTKASALTYSRASRIAKDGTFFTFRSSTDVYPFGHKILQWRVKIN